MSAEYYESAVSPTANASDIRLAIKAMVVDNTPFGWTHVEDWTESSTTWTVLKCAAASSGLPNDFHVVIAHPETTPGSSLSFFVCEGYDTTNHRMKRPHYNWTGSGVSGGTTPPSGANGSVGDDNTLYRPTTGTTVAARTAGTGLNAGHCAPLQIAFSSPAFVGVALYADGMNLTIKASSNSHVYMGAFPSLVGNAATNDPMPVCIFSIPATTASNYGTAGATRSAMNAGVKAAHSLIGVRWHRDEIVTQNTSLMTNETTWDKYAETPGPYLQPLMLVRFGSVWGNEGSSSAAGYLRGRLPYVLISGSPTGVAWGDTVDIGTDRYMYVGNYSNAWFSNNVLWIYIGPVPA